MGGKHPTHFAPPIGVIPESKVRSRGYPKTKQREGSQGVWILPQGASTNQASDCLTTGFPPVKPGPRELCQGHEAHFWLCPANTGLKHHPASQEAQPVLATRLLVPFSCTLSGQCLWSYSVHCSQAPRQNLRTAQPPCPMPTACQSYNR